MGLAFTKYDAATGSLREIYDKVRDWPLPVLERPGVAGIVELHSLDAPLIPKVFAAWATLGSAGPLSRAERELIAAMTARLDQCTYSTANRLELLRREAGDDALARAILESPQAVATSWPDARVRMLAELALHVTVAPWTLSRPHLSRARQVGLTDEDVLHAVTLAAFSGHIGRIAAAVDPPLDEPFELRPPPADPSTPPRPVSHNLVVGRPAIDIARRPSTATAFTDWRHYIFYSHDAPLTRRQRTVIARWVAAWLGDGGISSPADLTGNPLDDALRAAAEIVTLAPWKLGDATFAPLRTAGFDDAGIFDVCATATSAGVFSRIEVALAALAS